MKTLFAGSMPNSLWLFPGESPLPQGFSGKLRGCEQVLYGKSPYTKVDVLTFLQETFKILLTIEGKGPIICKLVLEICTRNMGFLPDPEPLSSLESVRSLN